MKTRNIFSPLGTGIAVCSLPISNTSPVFSKRRSNMKTSLKSAGRITGMFLSVVLLGGLCFAQTTNLYVSGSGFPASTEVNIYFDTTDLALAVTNSTGSYQLGTVPFRS